MVDLRFRLHPSWREPPNHGPKDCSVSTTRNLDGCRIGMYYLTGLAQAKVFSAWLRPLFRKDWVVYSKPPFGGPEHVLKYLGRYTHRVAISNHRLVSFAEGKVTFRWRESAHHNEQK